MTQIPKCIRYAHIDFGANKYMLADAVNEFAPLFFHKWALARLLDCGGVWGCVRASQAAKTWYWLLKRRDLMLQCMLAVFHCCPVALTAGAGTLQSPEVSPVHTMAILGRPWTASNQARRSPPHLHAISLFAAFLTR